jgi:hypothetical protein
LPRSLFKLAVSRHKGCFQELTPSRGRTPTAALSNHHCQRSTGTTTKIQISLNLIIDQQPTNN